MAIDINITNNFVNKKAKVVIIGAGLSGLTMGYRLLEKGYDVSVYEARSRVGGRVHSVYLKNSNKSYSIAELGAQNITDGGEAKYLLNLAKELGLDIEEDHRYLSRGFYTDKKLYDPLILLKQIDFSQENLEKIVANIHTSKGNMSDMLEHLFARNSILKRNFNYYIGSYEGLPCKDLSIIANVETLKYLLPNGRAGGKAALSDNKQKDDESFLLKYVRGGNSKLPLSLAKALKNKVFLDKILQKVFRVGKEIKLQFKDGTIVYCDKLILSIPAGVYDDISWDYSLFSKQRLIDITKVQYGLNGKIVIANAISNKQPLYNLVNDDHLGFFHNNDYKLLVGYTDGEWGKVLEKNIHKYYPLSIEMAEANYGKIENAHLLPIAATEEIFAKYDRPIFKSWAEDIYAKGSYSTIGIKFGKKFLEQSYYKGIYFKKLFIPIDDKIFFIGEHTSLIEEKGTMEAAIESAEKLANLF